MQVHSRQSFFDETGDNLRELGHEFGTVTGRPRRCGWLDLMVVKYAAGLNSLDYLAITRLDILEYIQRIENLRRL